MTERAAPANSAKPTSPATPPDSDTGLPGFRTWRGVYWFVFGTFVAVVIALTLFSKIFA